MGWLSLIAALSLSAAPQDSGGSAEPISIEYSVTQPGSNRVLLQGEMPLSPDRRFEFRRHGPKAEGTMTLHLRTRLAEPLIIVEVNWEESSAAQGKLSWDPLLTLRRGESLTASVMWGGEGRVLALKAR